MTMQMNVTGNDVTGIDRRRCPRRAVSQVVRLELRDYAQADQPAILVMDISSGGARLFAQGVELPDTFAVVFGDTGIRRVCRRVWCIGAEVGVEFVERAPNKRAGGAARRQDHDGRKRSSEGGRQNIRSAAAVSSQRRANRPA
jgi:hypothetical protein